MYMLYVSVNAFSLSLNNRSYCVIIFSKGVLLSHYLLSCRYAVILAFDVKIERDSQEMADSLGVRIFSAEIIYHLFDAFTKYREDYKKQKQEEFKYAVLLSNSIGLNQ